MAICNRLFITFLTAVASVIVSSAQSSARATASATIVYPLELKILREQDTTFTNVTFNAANVVEDVRATESLNLTKRSSATAVRVSVANFTINNSASYIYAISLPSSVTLTHSDGNHRLKVSTLISEKKNTGVMAGFQNFQLFADVALNEFEVPGRYTSDAFAVTIDHN